MGANGGVCEEIVQEAKVNLGCCSSALSSLFFETVSLASDPERPGCPRLSSTMITSVCASSPLGLSSGDQTQVLIHIFTESTN